MVVHLGNEKLRKEDYCWMLLGWRKREQSNQRRESWNLKVWNQTKVGSFELDLGFAKILFLRLCFSYTYYNCSVLFRKFVSMSTVL